MQAICECIFTIESIRLSTGALKLKEFIEKHVGIEKVDDVTKVLRDQQVTNLVSLKKLPRKWLVENLGEDAARDILLASVDDPVIHAPRTPPSHRWSFRFSHQN
jgi:DUF1009 family protein